MTKTRNLSARSSDRAPSRRIVDSAEAKETAERLAGEKLAETIALLLGEDPDYSPVCSECDGQGWVGYGAVVDDGYDEWTEPCENCKAPYTESEPYGGPAYQKHRIYEPDYLFGCGSW